MLGPRKQTSVWTHVQFWIATMSDPTSQSRAGSGTREADARDTDGHESGPRTSPRRHLGAKQADTVTRLLHAGVEEVREHGYDGLSIRAVAARAQVAPATAYTYFASKDHLVTEMFWQRLSEIESPPESTEQDTAERVSRSLSDIAVLAVQEPELASACTTAMLSNDAEVDRTRAMIGQHTHTLLRQAVGPDADPHGLQTLEAAWSGFMLQAGMGYIKYEDLPLLMEQAASVVFRKEIQ